MRLGLPAAVVILACSPLRADVEVRMAGERVSLRAVSAPVAEVLEQLARTTGMRVVYDGPVPRQSLTATLEAREAAEAVLSVLEGLGLNYALVMDPSGTRVEQLLILGAAAASAPSARNVPTGVPPVPRRNVPQDEDDTTEMVEAMEEDGVSDQQGQDDVADELDEVQGQPAPSPPPEPAQLPVPEYPSSSFTPKIPMPTPAPAASPTPPPPSRS